MSTVMILGGGRVGQTIASMMLKYSEGIQTGRLTKVTLVDQTIDINFVHRLENEIGSGSCKLTTITDDLTDITTVRSLVQKASVVVCCLPVSVMKKIVPGRICAEEGVSYLDVTEDVFLSDIHYGLDDLALRNGCFLVPQCGLAPGLINIMGGEITRRFDTCLNLSIGVGALPRVPTNSLGYAFTWSVEGLINEYINPCYAIINGTPQAVEPLEGLEKIYVDGVQLEQFNTSGGLGSMPCSFPTVDMTYKTMRYSGHRDLMKFLLVELGLKNDPLLMQRILTNAIPHTNDDLVFMRVVGSGVKNGRLTQETWTKIVKPAKGYTALQLTTGYGAAIIVDQLLSIHYGLNNVLNKHGNCKGGIVYLERVLTEDVLTHNPLNAALQIFETK